MTYKYQQVWDTIKANDSAEVTVSREMVATLIQGVRRTKSLENAARRKVGLIPYGKLDAACVKISSTGMMKVTFKLRTGIIW